MLARECAGFVIELVAGVAGARTLRTAALDHEVRDHAVPGQAVVETFADELDEVTRGFGGGVGEEFDLDGAFICVECG